jgi:HTH-type transcriptional regulator, competence development regulator
MTEKPAKMAGGRFVSMVRGGMRDSGVTLRGLCRSAELDPSFLSKVLTGKRSPPAEERSLRRIAEALRLDPAELVVAAGRVPSEWRRLSEDRSVFDAVQRLVTGKAPVIAVRPELVEVRTGRMSEELL